LPLPRKISWDARVGAWTDFVTNLVRGEKHGLHQHVSDRSQSADVLGLKNTKCAKSAIIKDNISQRVLNMGGYSVLIYSRLRAGNRRRNLETLRSPGPGSLSS